MTKTIILTNLVIDYLHIDYENQRILVSYRMVDANGVKWQTGEAIFWVTIPNPGNDTFGNSLPIPDNWFQLPTSYLPALVQLRDDADQALTAKFLV